VEAVEIRAMAAADLPAVMDIENRSFASPWLEEMFLAEIQGPVSSAIVAVEEGRIVGYATYRVILDEGHLMNLAIHPDFRGGQRGKTLLAHVIAEARRQGAEFMFLEVRESNYKAQQLYRGFGFYPIGRRRNYYSDNGEDAIVMRSDFPDVIEF
jgi:ribosomal-protein-alanine N-acetyltransferase